MAPGTEDRNLNCLVTRARDSTQYPTFDNFYWVNNDMGMQGPPYSTNIIYISGSEKGRDLVPCMMG
jgi:hypothetical protein